MLHVEPGMRPNVEDLLNLPNISIKLREISLKKNFTSVKKKANDVKKKQEQLLKKEQELIDREKRIAQKEKEIEELERQIEEMKKLKNNSSSTNAGTDQGNDSVIAQNYFFSSSPNNHNELLDSASMLQNASNYDYSRDEIIQTGSLNMNSQRGKHHH